jgi:hypothetical protein
MSSTATDDCAADDVALESHVQLKEVSAEDLAAAEKEKEAGNKLFKGRANRGD